ncbi:T-complex protein 11-domain-containing protein [Apodospora peruviana]|uniref:T-complex protein 11-domain-containing protein n=1 Tax=Apodospora peruviana TaxID=516989 RepID=A0AAE0HY40_9PEZI|nr:T-complex protein 11-domain-containing protein [Apodospora peruviana]
MGDQGAGGGIESHMQTHRRQDSGEEPRPTKTTPETRPPPQTYSEKQESTQARQGLARLSEATIVLNSEVGAAPALSRNPSTSSNYSNLRPTNEYLSVGNGDRRPQPPSRSSTASSSQSKRPLEPPVTKTTLGELDVSKIIHNPKLRHDINFDPELHFRPNLDGEKGKKKQDKANQFWTSLLEQLVQFVIDRDGFYRRFGTGNDWCLPLLLKSVKEIIETLVPQRDREFLDEGLNVELLMQQFHRGVADLESLAAWLSGVLKLHCAPMRDEWVDEMYHELSRGNRENDMGELVKGMRSLLSVLEAMKLDVANHQIRCLRPVLIEDTVQFEQRFFMRKMQGGKLSINAAKLWYGEARDYAARSYQDSPMPHSHAFSETGVFFEALSRLILPSTSTENIPNTFIFDEERIIKLRSDMYDSICLEICMRKFEDLERLSQLTQSFCSKVPAYVSEELISSGRSSVEFNFNTPPSSRPSSLAFSDRGSTTSSPRNSGGLFAQPVFDLAESRSKAVDLYSSLLALLQTAPPANRADQRWQGLAPSVALQILRYVNAPQSLPGFENQLAAWLGDVHGEIFHEVELQFQQRLLAELAERVKEFKNLSGVGLFSAATGSRITRSSLLTGRSWSEGIDRGFNGAGSPRNPRDEAGIDDMATRLAHLGILHWRVWSTLAYGSDIEIDLSTST